MAAPLSFHICIKFSRESSVLSFESFEGIDLKVLDEAVELLLGILIFVLLSANSYSDFPGHVSDASGPNESIETGIYTHILGEKFRLSESSNLSHCSGSSLFELNSMQLFVEVDGEVSGDGLQLLLLSFLCASHYYYLLI